jgi:hypothetical protein
MTKDQIVSLLKKKPLRKCKDNLWRHHTSGGNPAIPGYLMQELFYEWRIKYQNRSGSLVAVLPALTEGER